jgi:hypothetical protein
MAAALNPCSSSASTPAMVVPPGEHTLYQGYILCVKFRVAS